MGKRGSPLVWIRPLGRLLEMFIDFQVTALVAQERPDEGAEFAGDRDDDFVARKAPCGQTHEAGVEPVLCLPAQGEHPTGLPALAVREFFANFGRCRVMLGAFNEDPPRVGVASFRDTSLATFVATGRFAGNQPKVGHKLTWMIEAMKGVDSGFESPSREPVDHGPLATLDALLGGADSHQIVLQDDFNGRIGQNQFA